MYYGLVYFPQIGIEQINKLRQKYDPTYNLIAPHLPILFPVPALLGTERIIKHIESILKNWRSFEIHLSGFKKSWDHWLLLTIKNGNDEIKKLSVEIYSGFLSEYQRKDIEFIPHISLGLFTTNISNYDLKNPEKLTFDENKFKEALLEAESMQLDFKCLLDNLDFIVLNNDFTEIHTLKKIPI